MSDIELKQKRQQLRDFRNEFEGLCAVVQEITGDAVDPDITADIAYKRTQALFTDAAKLKRVREVFHRLEVLFGPFNAERERLFGPGPSAAK